MKKFLLTLCIPFLVGILACNLPGQANGSEAELQQTLDVLQTQLAEAAVTAEPSQTAELSPTPESSPTAQPNVSFKGVSFNLTADIASNAWGEVKPEYIPEYEGMEHSEPEHILFHFDNYAAPLHFHEPRIMIYPVDRLSALDVYAAEQVAVLNALLTSRPAIPDNYPFLPYWNAAAMFHSNEQYVDFQNGSGIRYLTQYGQAIYPINSTSLFYTFQGLTSDGRFYISAILPVNHAEIDDTGDNIDPNWEAYYDQDVWEAYITEQVTWLNSQTPESFTPSLAALDQMISSLLINR